MLGGGSEGRRRRAALIDAYRKVVPCVCAAPARYTTAPRRWRRCSWWAAGMVLSWSSRPLHFHNRRHRRPRRLPDGRRRFLALAHTPSAASTSATFACSAGRRSGWPGHALELGAGVAVLLAMACSRAHARKLAWQSALQRHLHRQRRDAAVDPAARDGRGTILAIAFVDDLVLELAPAARWPKRARRIGRMTAPRHRHRGC